VDRARISTARAASAVHLRGRTNILKRLLVHAAGGNLELLMRACYGVGIPRPLQGYAGLVLDALWHVLVAIVTVLDPRWPRHEWPVNITPMSIRPTVDANAVLMWALYPLLWLATY
jgi:hypothetical protein